MRCPTRKANQTKGLQRAWGGGAGCRGQQGGATAGVTGGVQQAPGGAWGSQPRLSQLLQSGFHSDFLGPVLTGAALGKQ